MGKFTDTDMQSLVSAIVTAKSECKDPYAQAYLDAIDQSMCYYGNDGLKTQLLYILNNMQYWRGDAARQVKKVFKDSIKKL